MITQAMILAAGKGTHMRPLTLTTPKPLIPVAGKPLIVWHIERLCAAGVTDVVINVGYLGEQIKEYLTQTDIGVRLHISDESTLSEPLETAGGIRHALAQGLLTPSPFVLVNGDVWTEYDMTRLCGYTLGEQLAHLVLTANPEHNLAGDFILSGDKVRTKPMVAHANVTTLTFAGLSVMSPAIVQEVTDGQVAPLSPYLRSAIEAGRITGELMADYWVDVGTLERLALVDDYAQNKYGKR